MANAYLSRTPSSTGNRRTFTLSAWCKKSSDAQMDLMGAGGSNSQNHIQFASDRFQMRKYTSSNVIIVNTDALLRDRSAWYHVVCAVDTTQSTASNRIKLYVNGELQSLNDTTYPSQDFDWDVNLSGTTMYVGRRGHSDAYFYDGIMAHYHWIDGTQYAASDFGETDSTTGIWKPILEPSVTYGTNGFFFKFDNASDFGEDSSGNNNDFSMTNTITQTIDTPSNNFATLNPIDNATAVDFTLSNGNTTLGDNGSGDNDKGLRATLGVSSGKYYWEIKKLETAGTIGILGSDVSIKDGDVVNNASSNAYNIGSNGSSSNIVYWQNGNFVNSSALQGWAANDIMGVALDMDNGKLFLSINGVFKGFDNNTSDPVNGTNANFTGIATDGTIFIPYAEKRGTANPSDNYNFGNGYFGTTAVSSAGTNAGVGTFEYDVPSGYKALCTKNINAEEYS
jgi:hypothetical protein|tara:strand:+ start:349 stop:1701 length:1353 start_codon:yes stop_codon:yes gene_type:complete